LAEWLKGRDSARMVDYREAAADSEELPAAETVTWYHGGWVNAIRAAGWTGTTAREQAAAALRGLPRGHTSKLAPRAGRDPGQH
jgi:hypothetical protein